MTVTQIICLVVVVLLTALGGFFIMKKSKEHTLAKWLLLFISLAIVLTWILPGAYYQSSEYYEIGMGYQGLTDIPNILYYSISFACDKIIFLIALGVFYAVLSKSNSYKKLVTRIAKKLKGKEILFSLVSSLLIVALTSLLSQTFVVLVFVPFIITIALNMKLDRLTAFAITFGSILVGLMGLTFGGEGLYYFNQYAGSTIQTAILYRTLVVVVAYVLFSFFNLKHVKKVLKQKNMDEIDSDPFKVEETKKGKTWPSIVLFSLLFILIILGFINWEGNFGITCFNEFHEWLIALSIGDFQIFNNIIGTKISAAFGAFNLFHATTILGVFSILFALTNSIKLTDLISACEIGVRKISKPLGLFIGVYVVMVIAYMSPFIPTISNAICGGVNSFNPFLTSFMAIIANIFETDLGYTGYIVASYFATSYADSLPVIQTIFTTTYGLVGLIAPTSALLLIGLSYLDIDYKVWVKYIWIFVVAMLVILLVLFTIMTYV